MRVSVGLSTQFDRFALIHLHMQKSRQNISHWVEKNKKNEGFLRIAQIPCLDFGHFDRILMALARLTDGIVFKIIRGWLDFKLALTV